MLRVSMGNPHFFLLLTVGSALSIPAITLLQVLNAAYVLVALLCTFLGVTGYLMYGPGVLDVITFNLPEVSQGSWLPTSQHPGYHGILTEEG